MNSTQLRQHVPNPDGRPLKTPELGKRRDWRRLNLYLPPDLEDAVKADPVAFQQRFEQLLRQFYQGGNDEGNKADSTSEPTTTDRAVA